MVFFLFENYKLPISIKIARFWRNRPARNWIALFEFIWNQFWLWSVGEGNTFQNIVVIWVFACFVVVFVCVFREWTVLPFYFFFCAPRSVVHCSKSAMKTFGHNHFNSNRNCFLLSRAHIEYTFMCVLCGEWCAAALADRRYVKWSISFCVRRNIKCFNSGRNAIWGYVIIKTKLIHIRIRFNGRDIFVFFFQFMHDFGAVACVCVRQFVRPCKKEHTNQLSHSDLNHLNSPVNKLIYYNNIMIFAFCVNKQIY